MQICAVERPWTPRYCVSSLHTTMTIVDSPYLSAIIVEVGQVGLNLLHEVLEHENRRVEEAVARNAALNDEFDKKKDGMLSFNGE
jgi:hypothetical protein